MTSLAATATGTGTPLGIIILPVLLIPGTILGWVAAKRIRQSDGQLYGLRLAVIAALSFPSIMVLILPLFVSSLIIRIGQFTSLGSDNAMWIGIATAVSLLILGIKLLYGCYLKLSGKGNIRESFRLRQIRSILIVLAIFWCAAGTLMVLQRPKPIVSPVTSTSPNGMFTASVGMWKQMNLFGPDKFSYHYQVFSHEGNVLTDLKNPIPREFLETNTPTNPHGVLKPGEYGQIIWNTEEPGVHLEINGITIHQERLPVRTAERTEND